jgi:hypothetical protein
MTSISNDILSISVAFKGAELQSLYHKQQKVEYMWSRRSGVLGQKESRSVSYSGRAKEEYV